MKKTFKITVLEGLHARPTTLLVAAVSSFESEITITYKEKSANLKSIMGVMSLAISSGAVIEIAAEGSDAQQLMDKVTKVIISQGIGEEC
ncbi:MULTISPECIES: HPr family phosphocarrier protein [unclassified Lysinibacillus]|uniref:HPr family phosphocarrier protein n=1 Tax=unclassified Lysinibacillus TaxID=2636778 RepID=UPI00383080B3